MEMQAIGAADLQQQFDEAQRRASAYQVQAAFFADRIGKLVKERDELTERNELLQGKVTFLEYDCNASKAAAEVANISSTSLQLILTKEKGHSAKLRAEREADAKRYADLLELSLKQGQEKRRLEGQVKQLGEEKIQMLDAARRALDEQLKTLQDLRPSKGRFTRAVADAQARNRIFGSV